jgi:hypothetical protein
MNPTNPIGLERTRKTVRRGCELFVRSPDEKWSLKSSMGSTGVATAKVSVHSAKLATGSLFSDTTVCGGSNSEQIPNGKHHQRQRHPLSTLCSAPLSQSASNLIALEKSYQQAFNGATISNPAFVGNSLAIGNQGQTVFSPNHRMPSSLQINFGVQREIVRGGVLSVDYIHSATEHIGQVIDTNHVGAACYFNPAAAQAAVAATLAAGSDCWRNRGFPAKCG